MNMLLLLLSQFIFGISYAVSPAFAWHIGTGIFDITGPAAQINLMGYANPLQTGQGIHLRLYSRAFVAKQDLQSRPIAFVSIDAGMSSQIVKTKVVMSLQSRYGAQYDHANVMISATHTHSGPAGFFQYLLYDITSLGFVSSTFNTMVDGIVQSIVNAHTNLVEGQIFINEGELTDASINRSPSSYLQNPKSERDRYNSNVDTKMTLLKFVAHDGRELGAFSWFPVHGTSMNNTNALLSSDNKGLASLWFESDKNPGVLPGKGPFVGAFAQANEGDVTPNIAGPRCIDTGEPCDGLTSTCNGRVANCIAFGPGKDMFESTQIIAKKQLDKARNLYATASTELTGQIKFRHQFIDMTNITVENPHGKQYTTCKPAMGYSFGAGTIDGPGIMDFKQGMLNGSRHWNFVRNLLHRPSKELENCHAPKPILLATGEMRFPYLWQPQIVETQLFQIGNFVITAVPGEFTTMSGRRVREAIKQAFRTSQTNGQSNTDIRIVIAGLANLYSSYVTTYEEYQLQRYEGASTIYGPHTLQAYVKQFKKLAISIVNDTQLSPGPVPPYFVDRLLSFVPPVLLDFAMPWRPFGFVSLQPLTSYADPKDTIIVKFVSANPRNNLRINGTFLTVEHFDVTAQNWKVRFTDANWETKFIVHHGWTGRTEVEIHWTVTDLNGNCQPGKYRIRHFGTAKFLFIKKNFEGLTKTFNVACSE